MRIKSYFAESVAEAMEKARLELGPDAMLVHSKRVESGLRHLGLYEVVFGLPQINAPHSQGAKQLRAPSKPIEQTESLIQELAHLRKQVETVSRSVSQNSHQLRSPVRSSKDSAPIQELLRHLDFSEDLLHELSETIEVKLRDINGREGYPGSHTSGDCSKVYAALRKELEARLIVAPGVCVSGGRIAMLVGAPGSGKTSTLVKLAVKEGFERGIPIQILSTDTMRLGGAEELASYARVLGAGFRAVHSPSALNAAVEEHKSKRLILIDTPGYDAGTVSEAAEWASFLVHNPKIEVQLALPANLRNSATVRILDRFSIFRPSRILLTKVDEAETVGSVLEPILRSGLPLSYLSCGQQIPEDIEEATVARLLDRLPCSDSMSARSAA